ncbi:MAG TPA: Lrp/AsnC family transcriptional regulator [Fimbriimonadaceae bacterium]|nr:Lrp/AsnC family transcriptional regulator [Fimbriimonadaceae bacterium]
MNEGLALDDVDLRILAILQREGRIANAALATKVGVSEAPCWRRVKRLQDMGLILGYHADLDRRRLGLDVFAVVHVRFSTHDLNLAGEFEKKIQGKAEVLTCHNVTGEVDYILTVVSHNLDAYSKFTTELRHIPGVASIHSSLSLREVKNTTRLPLER